MGHAYSGEWNPDYMLEGVCAAARLPPLLPDEVRRRLDEKKFTSKADVGVVDGLYRAFFDGAAASAMQLDFSGLGWGEAEARQLQEVLPRFTRFKALDLSRNKLGAAGASAIASLLKTMQISSLKRAAQPRTLPQSLRVLSAPIDTKANTFAFPSVSESEHVPFRTHVPCFGPQNLSAVARKRTRTRTPFPISPHPRNAALHRPPRGPRPRPPVGRVGRACSRAHLTPLRPPRHSLWGNNLNDEAKRAVKDAAGSGVDIKF